MGYDNNVNNCITFTWSMLYIHFFTVGVTCVIIINLFDGSCGNQYTLDDSSSMYVITLVDVSSNLIGIMSGDVCDVLLALVFSK